MIAVDTNVVIRLIVRDDREQVARGAALLADGIFLSLSVLMECEWVLRGGYRWPRDRINAALASFVRIEGVTVPASAEWVLARHAAGADLADMVHLVEAAGAAGFATFDRRLAAGAGDTATIPITTL